MGWRNYFIKLNKDDTEGFDIEDIEKFIDDHNSFYYKFTKEELEKMDDWNLPGEDLEMRVLVQTNDDKKTYWAYLGNHGGSSHTFNWMEEHYPDIKMFDSGDFPYYGDNWQEWPIMEVEDYKKIA